MFSIALQFLLSAAVIVAAGVILTRCADAIAEKTGLGRLLVGSVFLAMATSLPELLVDVNAGLMGLGDMAVGDLMGSSLFNLLILAIADLVHRSPGRMLSRQAASHALSAAMSMALTALAAIAILMRIHVSIGPFGLGSLLVLIAYLVGLRIVFYDQRFATAAILAEQKTPRNGLGLAIGGYLAGAAVVLAAAPYLAESAGKLATETGLGGTFIGTTLVAMSTSLPELVATLAAVRIGSYDLALGNVFGSNAFNMILLVPIDMAYKGPLLSDVSPAHAVTGLFAILITAVVVMGQLYHVEKRRFLLEPDAFLVILLVLAALSSIYYLG